MFPKLPYKGLASFEAEDEPLLSGRSTDIEQCYEFIHSNDKRILILHGSSGSGKSSFLKAGLIPYLSRNRYLLLNNGSGVIQSSSNPMKVISESVKKYIYCNHKKYENFEKRNINNSEIDELEIYFDKIELKNQLGENFILIIDQAEEVFTQNKRNYDCPEQEIFFQFLAMFSRSSYMRIKILVSLRTDYFGQFLDNSSRRKLNMYSTGNIHLRELYGTELINAIIRPTLCDAIQGYGIPRDMYRFYYDDNMLRQLKEDLESYHLLGPILPAMQVVCSTLYDQFSKIGNDAPVVITLNEYNHIGPLKDQIIAYLDRKLMEVIEEQYQDVRQINNVEFSFELNKWKKLLLTLIQIDSDGTILTKYQNVWQFKKDANEFNFIYSSDEIIDKIIYKLTEENIHILQLQKYNTNGHYDKETSVTLSHDCLAVALKEWENENDQNSKNNKYLYIRTYDDRKLKPNINSRNYSRNDLEYQGNVNPTDKLYITNDNIWDHQIVNYAVENKLFERLGFNVNIDRYANRLPHEKYYQYDSFLNQEEQPDTIIIPFPRSIIRKPYKKNSMDIAITNSYSGNALISVTKTTKYEPADMIGSLTEIIHGLNGARIIASDRATRDFFNLFKLVTQKMELPIINNEPILYRTTHGPILSLLSDLKYADYFLGTAPVKTAAIEATKTIVIDSNDLRAICMNKLKEDPQRYSSFYNVINQIDVNNSWNINIGYENWRTYKGKILRLASVALNVVDQIIENPKEMTNFIRKKFESQKENKLARFSNHTWNTSFYNCYKFVNSENYYDTYLHSFIDLNQATHKDVNNRYFNIRGSLEVYAELMKYKNQYINNIIEIRSAFPISKLNNEIIVNKIEKAKKHYNIHNYYDAAIISENILKLDFREV